MNLASVHDIGNENALQTTADHPPFFNRNLPEV